MRYRKSSHVVPDKDDIERNKSVEPLGEKIRSELIDWINRHGIVTMMLDTDEHCVSLDIVSLPPNIKPVLTHWGSIYVRDEPESSPLASEVAPGQCEFQMSMMTPQGALFCNLPKGHDGVHVYNFPFTWSSLATPAPSEPQVAEAPEPMSQESISERIAMASERQEYICARTRFSPNGSIGLCVFDRLQEMYNAGYAKAKLSAPSPGKPRPAWELYEEDGFWRYDGIDPRNGERKAFGPFAKEDADHFMQATKRSMANFLCSDPAAAPRPQEPTCPECKSTEVILDFRYPNLRASECRACEHIDYTAQFFSPAQSPQPLSKVNGNPLNTNSIDGDGLNTSPTTYRRCESKGHEGDLREPAQSQGAAPEGEK